MSNGHKWELMQWGDNRVRLAYWDFMHGEDTIIVLDKGKSYLVNRDDDTEEEVDLVEVLTGWLQEVATGGSEDA